MFTWAWGFHRAEKNQNYSPNISHRLSWQLRHTVLTLMDKAFHRCQAGSIDYSRGSSDVSCIWCDAYHRVEQAGSEDVTFENFYTTSWLSCCPGQLSVDFWIQGQVMSAKWLQFSKHISIIRGQLSKCNGQPYIMACLSCWQPWRKL
jgi:hypothetical protein